MPVWPLKWLLGRSEAETAGKFVKGKNSVKSVLCWQDPKSAQTQSGKFFHAGAAGAAGFPVFPWLKPACFIRACSCQDFEGEVSCLTRGAAYLNLLCLLGKKSVRHLREPSLFPCGKQLIKSSFWGHTGDKPISSCLFKTHALRPKQRQRSHG